MKPEQSVIGKQKNMNLISPIWTFKDNFHERSVSVRQSAFCNISLAAISYIAKKA